MCEEIYYKATTPATEEFDKSQNLLAAPGDPGERELNSSQEAQGPGAPGFLLEPTGRKTLMSLPERRQAGEVPSPRGAAQPRSGGQSA